MSMRLPWIVAALLVSAPLASAGSAPAIGFLGDGPDGVAGDGILKLGMPEQNESKMRLITGDVLETPTVFGANESLRAGTHLKGPLFVGIWPDASAVYEGNLSVTVKIGEDMAIERSISVAADPESMPDPEALVPGDPSDPEGAILHAMAQIMPALLHPPIVYDFGTVDIAVPAGANVSLELRLTKSDGTPPIGATTVIKYDGKLAPSFVYLPWWTADPQAQSPQFSQVPSDSSGGDSGGSADAPRTKTGPGDAGASEDNGEDSPGFALVPLAAVLAGLAIYRRRR